MPFNRKIAGEPEEIEMMRAAFRMVCDELALKCEADDSLTDVVIDLIVGGARSGAVDAERLRDHVLTALEEPESADPGNHLA
jgi:hypothetical protein